MKRYKDYLDAVEVSDTLHEKLKHLEEPRKRPRPWKGLAAMAAVMALIIGAGAWGMSRSGWGALMKNFRPAAEVAPEIADFPVPDIASEDPNGEFTAQPSGGGYEVIHGDADDPNTMVAYYLLPYLNWADADGSSMMDYLLAPPSAISRDAVWDDVLLFTGGAKAMADHLLWDGLTWGGTLWFSEDGTPCAASLYADGNGVGLFLEVMKGGEVPSCIVLPEEYYETSQWQGVKITALKNSGYMVTENSVELNEKREVSLYTNGTGYKLTLYAVDDGWADELCARFVRYAVDGGFHLYALSDEPAYDEDMSNEDSGGFDPDCPYCADGSVHTHAYDPSARS